MLLVTYVRRLGTSLTSVDTLAAVSATPLAPADRDAIAAHVTRVLADAKAYVQGGATGAEPPAPELEGDAATPLDAAAARVLRWAGLVAGVGHSA